LLLRCGYSLLCCFALLCLRFALLVALLALCSACCACALLAAPALRRLLPLPLLVGALCLCCIRCCLPDKVVAALSLAALPLLATLLSVAALLTPRYALSVLLLLHAAGYCSTPLSLRVCRCTLLCCARLTLACFLLRFALCLSFALLSNASCCSRLFAAAHDADLLLARYRSLRFCRCWSLLLHWVTYLACLI
jgi:hypothetical protein